MTRKRSPMTEIPGIGDSMAVDLHDLGFHTVAELRDQDPERMYRDLSALRGVRMDPCVLYVFRCAVYYASHEDHDPELLQWWSWKDVAAAERRLASRGEAMVTASARTA